MSNGGNKVPSITSAEHIGPADTGDNIEAKRVATYVWDGANWQRMTQPSSSSSLAKASDAYGIQAISNDGTYKYYFFEDDSANWYVMRKHITNLTFSYVKGTGGYVSVYQSSILGPSGTPSWANRGPTF